MAKSISLAKQCPDMRQRRAALRAAGCPAGCPFETAGLIRILRDNCTGIRKT
jgi:hypothetical protein